MKYTIWSYEDPNDTFEVEADDPADAAFAALDYMGWVVGVPLTDDEENDGAE